MEKTTPLGEIAKLFLKLGTVSFGGPAAHIAMMEDEVVKKRKWMTHEHFLDLIGATNLIPGPNSTEMTMHCGYERAGWKGLIVAGVSFIFPAVIITAILAWVYQKYGALPNAEPFIFGIKPAVIAIIAAAIVPLAKKAFKNNMLIAMGLATLIASVAGLNEIIAMFACGGAGVLIFLAEKYRRQTNSFVPFAALASALPAVTVPSLKIFLIFLKTGALLYGSGYVLFAFLDAELVSTGLLSREVLTDAVAAGQFTPGPVLSTATFIGWQMNGLSGALVATAGIFLPSFLFVALLNPILPKLRKSKLFSAFLDAVNAASVAVIGAVCIKMGADAVMDWRSILIASSSLFIALKYKKVNSALIVIAGSLTGYILLLL
ncbi:MAG: chromate transporter [Bacteroidetes bacterium HGW-Bacteroidetes-10]|nr:MAG: chromate transporter [Bacteroidetes bacterium HGW-Bacteroidetes-10]